jgi:DNA-binding transcriptional LysR family regulator
VRGSRPKVGLRPKTPHSDAGTRIEPLVSEPSVSATCPAATAAPEPPEEPPAMRDGSCGLRHGPKWLFSVVKP